MMKLKGKVKVYEVKLNSCLSKGFTNFFERIFLEHAVSIQFDSQARPQIFVSSSFLSRLTLSSFNTRKTEY